MDMNPIDATGWVSYLVKYGVPSGLAVGLYYVLPKIWGVIQQRLGIQTQQNDLTQVGISGVSEVITTLRNQMAYMTTQLSAMQSKIQEMSATLDQALNDKLIAKREAAQAKSDLFQLQLYVDRLIAQIKALGVTPVGK